MISKGKQHPLSDLFSLPQETDPQGRSKADPNYDPFDFGDEAPAPPSGKTFGVQVGQPKSLAQNYSEYIASGDPEFGGGKKKRAKPVDHNARTRDLIASIGYDPCKEETWRTVRGSAFKVDKYGLWDWSGIKPGRPLLYVQAVTGDEGLKRHLRAMTSDKRATDNRKRKIDNLRACLARGESLAIVVWTKQPNKRWAGNSPQSPRVVKITEALVDEVCSRKRKR